MLWYEAETRRIDPSIVFLCRVYRGCIYVCMYIWNYSMIRTFEEKFDTSVGCLLFSFQLVMELLE